MWTTAAGRFGVFGLTRDDDLEPAASETPCMKMYARYSPTMQQNAVDRFAAALSIRSARERTEVLFGHPRHCGDHPF